MTPVLLARRWTVIGSTAGPGGRRIARWASSFKRAGQNPLVASNGGGCGPRPRPHLDSSADRKCRGAVTQSAGDHRAVSTRYHEQMNLQAQIELITVPQDFSRLCNAVLRAEYGDDFLSIDDDRSDRGNDGYLKSEKRMFAAHCFKRVQNQSLDREIRHKMVTDLQKAIQLNQEGVWPIEAWTFISNYPIAEAIAKPVILLGRESGIDAGWRGSDYLAEVLQKYKNVRELFPNLLASEIMEQLGVIIEKLETYSSDVAATIPITWAPRSVEEQRELVIQRPIGWEVLLFAGILLREKERLEFKWRDFEVGYAPRSGRHLNDHEALSYLGNTARDAGAIIRGMMTVFDEDNKTQAFGLPGEPGNAVLITHFARRVIGEYEEFIDWAAGLRGLGVSERMAHVFELAALIAGQPARDIRKFVDQVVYNAEQLSTWLSNPVGKAPDISVGLILTVDDAAVQTLNIELSKLERELL